MRNQRGLRKLMEVKDFAKLALLQDAANTDSTGQAILHYEGVLVILLVAVQVENLQEKNLVLLVEILQVVLVT